MKNEYHIRNYRTFVMKYTIIKDSVKKYSIFDDNRKFFYNSNSKEEIKMYLNLMFGNYRIKRHIVKNTYEYIATIT